MSEQILKVYLEKRIIGALADLPNQRIVPRNTGGCVDLIRARADFSSADFDRGAREALIGMFVAYLRKTAGEQTVDLSLLEVRVSSDYGVAMTIFVTLPVVEPVPSFSSLQVPESGP